MEGVIAEHGAIKPEVGLLRQLVETSGAMRDGEREDEDFGGSVGGRGGSDDDDARAAAVIWRVKPRWGVFSRKKLAFVGLDLEHGGI